MTTPKDTWISVKDANIPSKIPKGFFLLLCFKYKNKKRISYYDSSYKVNLSKVNWDFWMLLSKPKNK